MFRSYESHRARAFTRPLLTSIAVIALTGLVASSHAGAQPAQPQPGGKDQPAKPGEKPKLLPRVLPPIPLPKKDAPAPGDKDKKDDGKKDDKKDDGQSKRPKVAGVPMRWTDATPDRMADDGIQRAKAGGDDALAGLLVTATLDDRVNAGEASRMLANFGKSDSPVADDARMLAQELIPPPMGKPWEGWAKQSFDMPPNRNGVVQTFAILGPFQDTGGGLTKAEGPEQEGQSFADAKASYSWGVYEVAWRRTLPETSTAEGLPLDLYIAPRAEVCTYLATAVTFDASTKSPVVVHVASTGSLRLMWDGVTVGSDDDVHQRAIVDRMAAKIEPSDGAHLLALKVCSGSQADDGRVRVRFTNEAGQPMGVPTSSDLSGIAGERARNNDAPSAKPGKPGAPPAKPGAPPAKPGAPPAPAKPGAPPAPLKPAASSGKVVRVKTPLEAAIDAGKDPSADEALAAAAVRTLAGADDLRSPRAPGLLDKVTRDPSVTADELAMAGWLSSFGANKSGWLNDARARAAAKGDDQTLGFTLRRIAENQYRTGRDDWALATLQADPFKSATDVEAKVIRIELASRLGGAAEREKALDELQAIDRDAKQQVPLFVLQDLQSFSSDKPELAAMYARRLAEKSSWRPPSLARYAGLADAAAFERAAAQLVVHQTNARSLVSLGRDLLKLGRHVWAREILYTATKLSPNSADAFDALAAAREVVLHDEQTAGAPLTDDPSYATAAEQRALALRPTDTRQKDEIAFRTATDQGGKTETKQAQDDEKYLVASSVIVDRAKKNPAKVGEVFERQLHFMRVVTYHPDKRVSQLIHYAREIVVEPRTDDELYERDMPVEGDSAELVFARVHRTDGTVVEADEQSSGGMPYVKWPELKRGDIVEVAVRSWTAGPVGRRGDAPFYFIDYVGSTQTKPVLFNEVIVDSPGDALAVDVVNGKADHVEESTEGDRKITKLIWDNPPTVPDEPLAPRPTEVLPIVVGSTYKGWNDFREWYRDAVHGFSEPDEEIKQLAADLTKGKKTQKEKLEAIFNFVADDIRYVNYVSGEWWLPNRPQQLLARRQGDCDDKATLLISLLKAIGVEASPVLVQTRLTAMPSVLASTKVAVPMFDHGIAYLPGKNGEPGTWLDATSPQSRLGPLPSMDARARALFVYEGDAKIIETPPSSPADNGSEVTWTVKLGPTGAADITAKEKHEGDWAFELRNYLVEKAARSQWVEGYLTSRWLSTVALKGEVDYSADAGTLGYVAHSDSFARREGDELVMSLAGQQSYTSWLAPLVKRTLPVSLPPSLAPSHSTRSMTLTAPDGFEFADPPPDGEQKGGAFGSAKLSFKPSGDKKSMVVESNVIIDKSIIPVADYDAFRAWLQNVDGMMRSQLRLVPVKGAADKKPRAEK